MLDFLSNLSSWNLLEMIPLYLQPVVVVFVGVAVAKAVIGIVMG